MQPGKMDRRVEVLELSPELTAVPVMQRWVSIRSRDSGAVAASDGLRSAGMVEVRGWFSGEYRQGRYIVDGNRLLVIADGRDPMGNGAEIIVSCYELIGHPAEYRPAEGRPVPCRVHLTHEAPWLDEMGAVTSYKTRAEVALIEVGRPQGGDQIHIMGTLYNVIAYADESDDGVVRGLWLEDV